MEHRTYEKMLKLAIGNEIKANKFYSDAAAKLDDSFLKELFTSLAAEEARHREILDGFRSADTGSVHFGEFPDYKVAETVDEPEPSLDMKPADAFALAMKMEEEAMNLYSGLADACYDIPQKELLLELAAMEREHKFRMETAFVDIAYPEVW